MHVRTLFLYLYPEGPFLCHLCIRPSNRCNNSTGRDRQAPEKNDLTYFWQKIVYPDVVSRDCTLIQHKVIFPCTILTALTTAMNWCANIKSESCILEEIFQQHRRHAEFNMDGGSLQDPRCLQPFTLCTGILKPGSWHMLTKNPVSLTGLVCEDVHLTEHTSNNHIWMVHYGNINTSTSVWAGSVISLPIHHRSK